LRARSTLVTVDRVPAELLRDIATRTAADFSPGRISLRIDDVPVEADVVVGAATEVSVACPGLGGFELSIRPGRPLGPRVSLADHWFEAAFAVSANDEDLARVWLDAEARAAVAWAQATRGLEDHPRNDYAFAVGGGRVVAVAAAPETSPLHLERAIRAAAVLALRPRGIARDFRRLGRRVGATPTGERWDLEGGFALTLERGPALVSIDNVRRLPDEPRAVSRLRTRVRAQARATGGGTDAFVVLPRRARFAPPAVPPEIAPRLVPVILESKLAGWTASATAPAQLGLRLEHAAARLLAEADPDAILGVGAEVALLYEGMDTAPWRMGAAIELAAFMVGLDRAARGPYR
jgi:hypothetical protein